jgi:nitrogenase molybdenum-cofactor synthesis protein NifE
MANKARQLVTEEISKLIPALKPFREKLEGKKAAIYVGGAFKAVSLIKALRLLGIKTVIAGSQTGNSDDYNMIQQVCDEGTIIVDDSNPMELQNFIRKTGADIFIGGVKERPIAFKLGIGFCDHNHERKEALAGYKGMMNFAKEVYATINSPVWQFVKNRKIIKN